jgi:endonuclease III
LVCAIPTLRIFFILDAKSPDLFSCRPKRKYELILKRLLRKNITATAKTRVKTTFSKCIAAKLSKKVQSIKTIQFWLKIGKVYPEFTVLLNEYLSGIFDLSDSLNLVKIVNYKKQIQRNEDENS